MLRTNQAAGEDPSGTARLGRAPDSFTPEQACAELRAQPEAAYGNP